LSGQSDPVFQFRVVKGLAFHFHCHSFQNPGEPKRWNIVFGDRCFPVIAAAEPVIRQMVPNPDGAGDLPFPYLLIVDKQMAQSGGA
jgi:hypothetical protein